MTKSKHKADPSHPRRKRHNAAVKQPNVRRMIRDLKQEWNTLSPVERGDALRQLVQLGCTTRGLEDELGRSDTNIRRNIKIAGLPEEHRTSVEQGTSAKRILTMQRDRERQQRRLERIDLDGRTGEISDAVATVILEFCRRKRLLTADLDVFFPSVLHCLSLAYSIDNRAVGAPGGAGLTKLFRQTRPSQAEDSLWLAHRADWLSNVLCKVAPEAPIYERAIQKAKRLATKALGPCLTSPQEAYIARVRRLAYISSTPARRSY